MKLAVLSQHTLDPAYSEISQLQYEYCLKKFKSLGIPTFRHVGSLDSKGEVASNLEEKLKDNYYFFDDNSSILNLKCRDLIGLESNFDPRGCKTYYAFKYLIENVDFDILFTTTCTSYLDVDSIIHTVSNLTKKEKLYTGAVSGWESQELWFVISAFAFISRDLVEKIVANKELYLSFTSKPSNINTAMVYEDVCIGRVLKHLGEIKYNEAPCPNSLYQPYFVHPPKVYKDKTPVDSIEKCRDCLTYRVEKDYIEGYKKIHSLYTN